jgi:hypothetical protein
MADVDGVRRIGDDEVRPAGHEYPGADDEQAGDLHCR